ncbi:hypothetical protein BGZ70_003757 [Mortierella alpina]|uniref:Uncharacterized protein n=1 Tax=Mortierella alpina TaxID=64518 RepID=A0A9P6JA62_MORAP|nr:hypothetical protein BGZ70_003757 [Mortierella alpina]
MTSPISSPVPTQQTGVDLDTAKQIILCKYECMLNVLLYYLDAFGVPQLQSCVHAATSLQLTDEINAAYDQCIRDIGLKGTVFMSLYLDCVQARKNCAVTMAGTTAISFAPLPKFPLARLPTILTAAPPPVPLSPELN